ncbi:MAG: site-specific DNA recombinase [Alphaproteobacteria bacterium]
MYHQPRVYSAAGFFVRPGWQRELWAAPHTGWSGNHLDVVERVELSSDQIAIGANLSQLTSRDRLVIRHIVPTCIRRRGIETKLVLMENQRNPSKPDPALIKAVLRAHRWFEDLTSGRAGSRGEIARRENLSDRYIGRLLPLSFLAPDIVEAILRGNQTADITVEMLTRQIELPLGWAEQRTLLGFVWRLSAQPNRTD